MKECSLPHHVSGVCDTCPNKEECGLKVILAMSKKLDQPYEEKRELHLGEAID